MAFKPALHSAVASKKFGKLNEGIKVGAFAFTVKRGALWTGAMKTNQENG